MEGVHRYDAVGLLVPSRVLAIALLIRSVFPWFCPSRHSDVSLQGHFHPRIVETLVEQAQKLTLSPRAFYNSVFPKRSQRCSPTRASSGAEAVKTAMKLSRKWAYMKKGVPEGSRVERRGQLPRQNPWGLINMIAALLPISPICQHEHRSR